MTPADLERALRPLIDSALAVQALRAQARVAADALERFGLAAAAAAPRQSARVAQALALVDGGTHTALEAARAAGVPPSTVYRAIARRRGAQAPA